MILDMPAFSARRGVGEGRFEGDHQDPATLAPLAFGAKKVPAEEIDMGARNEDTRKLDASWPFANRPELFDAYELLDCRVAPGEVSHHWPSQRI